MEQDISRQAHAIKINKIIIRLTDTVYGILGDAMQEEVVDKIYKIKNRDKNKPLIVLISKIDDIERFGVKIASRERAFCEKYWPGPNTIIFDCGSEFYYLHRGTKTLGFRVPKNKDLLELLNLTGPLVAPSANPEGLKPAITYGQALKYFDNCQDCQIINNGRATSEKASSIIVYKTNKILRK